jgi:hypothetical protein
MSPAVPGGGFDLAVPAMSPPAGRGHAEHRVLRPNAGRLRADTPVLPAHADGRVLRTDRCDTAGALLRGSDTRGRVLRRGGRDGRGAHAVVLRGGPTRHRLLPAPARHDTNARVLPAPPGGPGGDRRGVLWRGGRLLRCDRRDLVGRLLRRAHAPDRRRRIGRQLRPPVLPHVVTVRAASASLPHGSLLRPDARRRHRRCRGALLPEGRDVRPPAAVPRRRGDLPAVRPGQADRLSGGLTTPSSRVVIR